MTLDRRLRMGVLGILAILVVVGIPEGWVGGLPEGELRIPPPLEVRLPAPASGASAAEPWADLHRHAAEAPLRARVSGESPPLVVQEPSRLRAGRAGSLRLEAFQPSVVRLEGPDGRVQEAEMAAGESRALLLEPRLEGWATWTLTHRGMSGMPMTVTRWVEPPSPLRILVLTGPPGQESRLAMLALEEAGEEVEAWIHLGRDLWIGRDPGPLPADPESYRRFDLVVLFPGLALDEPAVSTLMAAVRTRGMGLLVAGPHGAGVEALRRAGGDLLGPTTGVPVRGDTLAWPLPVEIAPLPSEEVEARLRVPVEDAGDPTDDASGAPPGPADAAQARGRPLVLAAVGRGRVGALALDDTWRWRMEAGAVEGHRAFWQTTGAWLAGGLVGEPALEVLGADHRTGEAVTVRWVEGSGAAGPVGEPDEEVTGSSPRIQVTGPGGVDTLELSVPVRRAGLAVASGRFVPESAGGHHLVPLVGDDEGAGEGSRPGVGVMVQGVEASGLDPSGRLARLALASPGGGVEVLPRDPADPGWAARWAAEGGWLERLLPRSLLPAVLFLMLGGVLVWEWTFRRRRGWP